MAGEDGECFTAATRSIEPTAAPSWLGDVFTAGVTLGKHSHTMAEGFSQRRLVDDAES